VCRVGASVSQKVLSGYWSPPFLSSLMKRALPSLLLLSPCLGPPLPTARTGGCSPTPLLVPAAERCPK
jgi:hypothetical protein